MAKKISLSELEKLIKKSTKGSVSKSDLLPIQKKYFEDILKEFDYEGTTVPYPYNDKPFDYIFDWDKKGKDKETSKRKLQEENKKLKEQLKKEKTAKTKLKNKLEKENKKLKKEVEDLKNRNIKLNRFNKFDIIDLED